MLGGQRQSAASRALRAHGRSISQQRHKSQLWGSSMHCGQTCTPPLRSSAISHSASVAIRTPSRDRHGRHPGAARGRSLRISRQSSLTSARFAAIRSRTRARRSAGDLLSLFRTMAPATSCHGRARSRSSAARIVPCLMPWPVHSPVSLASAAATPSRVHHFVNVPFRLGAAPGEVLGPYRRFHDTVRRHELAGRAMIRERGLNVGEEARTSESVQLDALAPPPVGLALAVPVAGDASEPFPLGFRQSGRIRAASASLRSNSSGSRSCSAPPISVPSSLIASATARPRSMTSRRWPGMRTVGSPSVAWML